MRHIGRGAWSPGRREFLSTGAMGGIGLLDGSVAGGAESPIGRTRTLPRPGTRVDSMCFAFVSCQDWQNGFYSAYLLVDDVPAITLAAFTVADGQLGAMQGSP